MPREGTSLYFAFAILGGGGGGGGGEGGVSDMGCIPIKVTGDSLPTHGHFP